ncbi:MAG TPA: PIN domain-containing protein [Solirubrobacteraceae bacterium]|jgi:predicted nucleic acid-binding protein|nr:PIN domain-containing protein [Solirubrobacteraceae bacterium]
MSDKTFVDTNVFVYAIDDAEPAKRDRAQSVLISDEYGEFVVSSQVLGEFYVTVTRKLGGRVSATEAEEGLDRLYRHPVVPVDATLVRNAIKISRSSHISYWDGLVVAAAARAGCERLLSEDLNDGQVIGSVCIENPFRDVT